MAKLPRPATCLSSDALDPLRHLRLDPAVAQRRGAHKEADVALASSHFDGAEAKRGKGVAALWLRGGGAVAPQLARQGVVAKVRRQLLQPTEAGDNVCSCVHHGRVVRVPRLQHGRELAPTNILHIMNIIARKKM